MSLLSHFAPASEERTIIIGAATARLRFQGCTPEYIKNVCHGRCCESSAAEQPAVLIYRDEQAAIAARGGTVHDDLLTMPPGRRTCTFKTDEHFCALHGTGDKPAACTMSPWRLSPQGTRLIIRNRYKFLICYRAEGSQPAYRAFQSGLTLIFGPAQTAQITAHFDAGGGDYRAVMTQAIYEKMVYRDKRFSAYVVKR